MRWNSPGTRVAGSKGPLADVARGNTRLLVAAANELQRMETDGEEKAARHIAFALVHLVYEEATSDTVSTTG